MSFPTGWQQLPGPSHLLDVLLDDVGAGYTVALALPVALPKGEFAVEMSERVYARKVGTLVVFRDQEVERYAPRELFLQKIQALRQRTDLILLDIRDNQARAEQWLEYFGCTLDFSDWPGGCIVMKQDCVKRLAVRKGIRSRSWRDFVGAVDCRVMLHIRDRDLDVTPEYRLLRDALIVEFAGENLARAHSLSDLSLRQLLDESTFDHDRIWSAQVSVLFPIVDRERRRILSQYWDLWVIPYHSSGGRMVSRVMDLEIRDMVAQAESNSIIGRELRLLRWLRRVRNLIAHMRVVRWGTLVSGDSNGVVDFRES